MARSQSMIIEIEELTGHDVNIMFTNGKLFGPYKLIRTTQLGDAMVVQGSKDYIINLAHVMVVSKA
jgi:hypothetical protein